MRFRATFTTQIAALRSGEAHAPLPAAPGQLGGGGLSPPEQMVALACMCSSPIIVDARKRTKGERPDADASDVRLVLRQRSSMPQQPKPSVLLPFAGLGGGGPIGSAQGQQMWLPPQPQFASQAPASTAQLQPLQQQQFYTHVLPPHTNAAKPPAQLGVVVAAPIRVFSAVPEPIGEVVEACGDALIELQARIWPACIRASVWSAPAVHTLHPTPRTLLLTLHLQHCTLRTPYASYRTPSLSRGYSVRMFSATSRPSLWGGQSWGFFTQTITSLSCRQHAPCWRWLLAA